ncbi:MAG TPA: type I secretion C-terminal target domain-containing protein [Caulobacteraceae bacterium]|jgi:Ca2+-binding RTX toxin-like protein
MSVDSLAATGAATSLSVSFEQGPIVGFAALQQDQFTIIYQDTLSTGVYLDELTYGADGRETGQTGPGLPLLSYSEASAGGYGLLGVVEQLADGTNRVQFTQQEVFQPPVSPSFSNGPQFGGVIQSLPGVTYSLAGAYVSATGFHREWVGSTTVDGVTTSTLYQDDVDANGVVPGSQTQTTGAALIPFSGTLIGASALSVEDNQVQLAGQAAITLTGEAPGAVTALATAGLATNAAAAVAWTDSAGAHLSLFDAASNSLSPEITLASGPVSDLQVLAAPDGSFVAGWMSGGVYQGEVFNAEGQGGGVMTLAGELAGFTSGSQISAIGVSGTSTAILQTYALGDEGAAVVHTDAASYTASDTVIDIYLTGSNQTVVGNGAGDVFFSTDTANRLYGGAGDDLFHLGRGGDVATGGGGNDTFDLAAVPWSGGHITDFNAGDVLDLSGLMQTTSDTGTDGFADGYLKITDDGQGNAQVWADYNVPGNDGWWLVETLDGAAPASLKHDGDVITASASSGGGGGTTGQTFTSDDSGDHWTGTAGDDTFNLGRGGDVVTGNGGNDTYRFAGIPWAGGHITDFNAGDVLDLSGLMQTTADTGTDGFADGYLKITDDGTGNAQVWADYHLPGNDGWWLVETLDGVAPASLAHSGAVITVGSSSGGGGGTTGQTFTSDDNGDTWVGTAGNDVFHLGRGGDTVTGGAGADTFAYAAIPWAGGHITDFNAAEGDKIDVSGLLSQAGYTGSDPIADGFLKFGADNGGNAQVWADYNAPGNNGWWLVATLDGVSTSSLHYSGGLIT